MTGKLNSRPERKKMRFDKRWEKAERHIQKMHPNIRKQYRKARYRKATSRFDLMYWKLEQDIPVESWELYRHEPWLY